MSKQPESLLKERVVAKFKQLPNCWFVKIQQTSINGTPDILMCVSGLFVAVELKTDTGELSALQVYNLDKIAKIGGISIVLTPKNSEEIFIFLEKIAVEGAKYSKANNKIN